MSASTTKTAINNDFDIHSVCKRCMADDHWSKDCRNDRIFFCWICGRKNIKTADCCSCSKNANQAKSSNRITYPEEPIYFDNKKGLCATVGFGYDLVLAKIDTSSFRSFIGELYANELGTATNIKKANVFVTMQDGSEKYFNEELRTRMKFGNWQGYMTFLICDELKGHIVLGLDFLTLTNAKLSTCGVSFTLSESKAVVKKDTSAASKTNVKTVSTSTSPPPPPAGTNHTEAVGKNHAETFSNMHQFNNQHNLPDWGAGNTHNYSGLNWQCTPSVSGDNSLASLGERISHDGPAGTLSVARLRPDPNFERYILNPDNYPAKMCELIHERQKIHQQNPKAKMKFIYVFDGILYRIILCRISSEASVRVLGPVLCPENVENNSNDSTVLNVTQKALQQEPIVAEPQYTKKYDPTFVRYIVPPAEWSEEMRNIIDEAKASHEKGLLSRRRFTKNCDGMSYRICLNSKTDMVIVKCLGPVAYVPLNSTTASTSTTQSTDSTHCVDMDLETDDEAVPAVSNNKALETEDISSEDEDYSSVIGTRKEFSSISSDPRNEFSSISSDTEFEDLVLKDDQKKTTSTKAQKRRKRIETGPEFAGSSAAKIICTVGSSEVSSKSKKTSEITSTVSEEKHQLDKSDGGKEKPTTQKDSQQKDTVPGNTSISNITKSSQSLIRLNECVPESVEPVHSKDSKKLIELPKNQKFVEAAKQNISTEELTKPAADSSNPEKSTMQGKRKISTETNVQEANVNEAAVEQTITENDKIIDNLIGTKVAIKRASEEKTLKSPPNKMICMESTAEQSNKDSFNSIPSKTTTVLDEPNNSYDSDCVLIIDESKSNDSSEGNTGQDRKSLIKKLPFDSQLETICISDDDDIEAMDITIPFNTFDSIVCKSKTERNNEKCEAQVKLKSNQKIASTIKSSIVESTKKAKTPTKTAADKEPKNPNANNGENQENKEGETHSKRLITTEEQPEELKSIIMEIRRNWAGLDKEKSFMRVFNGVAYFVQLFKGKGEVVYARKWATVTPQKTQQQQVKPSTSLAAKLAQENQPTNSATINRPVTVEPKTSEKQLDDSEQQIDASIEKTTASKKECATIEANELTAEIPSYEESGQESKPNEAAYWPFPENAIDQITLPLSEMTEEICNHAVMLSEFSKSEKLLRRVINGVPYSFCYNNSSDQVKVQRLVYAEGNKDISDIARTVPDDKYVTLKELTSQLTSKKRIPLKEAPTAVVTAIKKIHRSKKRVYRLLIDGTVYLVYFYNASKKLKVYSLIFDAEVQKMMNTIEGSNDKQAAMSNFDQTHLDTAPWPFEDSPIDEMPVAAKELPQELKKAIQELQENPIGREISFRQAIDGIGYTVRINKSCTNVRVQRYIYPETAISSEPQKPEANVDEHNVEAISQLDATHTKHIEDVPCTVAEDKPEETIELLATSEGEKKPTENTKQNDEEPVKLLESNSNDGTNMSNAASEGNADEIIEKMKQITIVTLENNGEVIRITLQDPMFWAKWQHLVNKVLVPVGEEPEELRKVIDYHKKRSKPKSISIRHVINDEFYAVIIDRKNRVRQCRITFIGKILNISNGASEELTKADVGAKTESTVSQQKDQTTTIVTVEYNGQVFHITLEDEDFWFKWKHLVRKEALSPGEEPQELKHAIDEYNKRAEHKDCSFRLAINGNFYTITVDKNGCIRSGRLIFTCAILKTTTKGCREFANDEEKNLCEATKKTSINENKTTIVTETALSENSSNAAKVNTSSQSLQSTSSINQEINQQVVPNLSSGTESDLIDEMDSFLSSATIGELLEKKADAITTTATNEKALNLTSLATKELEGKQPASNKSEDKQKLETNLESERQNVVLTENEEKGAEFISSKEASNQIFDTPTKQPNSPLDQESQISALSPAPTTPASSTFPNKPLLKIRTPAEIAKLKTLPFVNGSSSGEDCTTVTDNKNDNTGHNDELLDEFSLSQFKNNDFKKIKFNLKSKSK